MRSRLRMLLPLMCLLTLTSTVLMLLLSPTLRFKAEAHIRGYDSYNGGAVFALGGYRSPNAFNTTALTTSVSLLRWPLKRQLHSCAAGGD